jgi:hypothetical protein
MLQACVMYRDSKKKFKKAMRGAMILTFIVLLLLAANVGLVFAVVYLTKVQMLRRLFSDEIPMTCED